MGNIITIPRGHAPTEPKGRCVPRLMAERKAKAKAKQATVCALKGKAAPAKAQPAPDVRQIMRENAQLRADLTIARNRLKVYEMRYGEPS